jgi:virginiamycin B lyase
MRPITEFPALAPGQLALGADNNIWYATSDTSIGRISPTGVVTVFEIGYGMRISAIAAGIDGKIWWLNDKTADELVGRMALDGTGAEWRPLPMQYSGPVGITAGPGAMWFTQALSRQIGSVTSTWAFNEFSLDGQIAGDFDIVDGPDGNLWFTTSTNSICRVTPNGVPTCFSVPTPPNASQTVFTEGIAVGPDGNVWFTGFEPQTDGATIGRITPSGSVTLFPLPDAACRPTGITTGPDGNIWFTENAADYVGRITPTGHITEFPIPTAGAQMGSIVTGADGKIWFSEPGVDKIGTIAP